MNAQAAACSEEIVVAYESLEALAREQVATLRRGDVAGLTRVVEAKERIVSRIRRTTEDGSSGRGESCGRAQEPIDALGQRTDALALRAEKALVRVLDLESEAIALITGLCDAIGNELSLVTRGDGSLRSYRGTVAARLVDERR